MSDTVGAIMERKDRPAFAKFVQIVKEDKAASQREGRFVGRDVDMVHVTPPYSKDVIIYPALEWFEKLERDVAAGRIPREWVDQYRKDYDFWKRGLEAPPNGVPVKGWGVISPAQQEELIRLNIRTVEDLAAINDEGLRRIGMGGVDLKTKASAWLAQLKDKGPLTVEMAALKVENVNLKTSLDSALEQLGKLRAQIDALAATRPEIVSPAETEPAGIAASAGITEPAGIAASDIIEDEPKPALRARKMVSA